ncbi:MAG: 50S ribosomal protein L11 methyltransferase [Anaerolineae bacterium]|jgi:ribosomal protein L11 methyltransferase
MAMGDWVEISVACDSAAADDLAAYLSRYCAGGAAVEQLRTDPNGRDLEARWRVKGFVPADDQATQQKIEIALLLLSRDGSISEPLTRLLQHRDWAEAWKEHFPVLRIGQRLVVAPTWREHTPADGEVVVRLDPGMAFGTGLHATTRLCMVALEGLVRPGDRVLDVGAGSGILSIAAALLGAGAVSAVDVDPICVQVTAENARLNGVADRVTAAAGTLATGGAPRVPLVQETGYDLVLANILAEVIIDMAHDFPRVLRSGGRLVVSGILAEKAADVAEALEAEGLQLDDRLLENGWAALVASRP